MKYRKLAQKFISQRTNDSKTEVFVALIAGLAVGAVISVLFAPGSGSDIRKGILDKAKDLGTGLRDSYGSLKDKMFDSQETEESNAASEVPHFTHNTVKKRKSDIKDLVSEAHQESRQSEEN